MPHVIEIPSGNIEEASKVFAEHGDRIAAVISEPIQETSSQRLRGPVPAAARPGRSP